MSIRDLKVWLTKPALVRAAQRGNLDKVMKHLGKGANVNARDGYGRTALMEACREGNIEIVKILPDHGAKVRLHSKSGQTAMSYAENRDILELLWQNKDQFT